MMRSRFGFMRVTAVALIVALAGCVDARDVGGPPPGLQPAAAVVASSAAFDLLKGTFPNPSGNGVSCDVRGQASSNRLQSAVWIDAAGGQVALAGGVMNGRAVGHVLTVPANTVSSPTLFCMKLAASNHMQVRLEALALDAAGNVIDVGQAGFRRPVLLTLSFAPVSVTAAQARGLAVVYDRENGAPVEPMRSTLLLSSYGIQAELEHFSMYALAYSKYAMAVD